MRPGERVDTFIGKTESELIACWGMPDVVKEVFYGLLVGQVPPRDAYRTISSFRLQRLEKRGG